MSCGHDGCTCGRDDQTAEQHTRHEQLPTIGERSSEKAGCCGGHGGHGHHRQHDAEARAGQGQLRT